MDFFIIKGIGQVYLNVDECYDLHSDHSPVLLTISTTIIVKNKPPQLHNHHTDWDHFREAIEENISLNAKLKTPKDIERAVENLLGIIQDVDWKSTPTTHDKPRKKGYPAEIANKIAEKRRLRHEWQRRRYPDEKHKYNNSARELKKILQGYRDASFKEYLEGLSATESNDYSLW